MIASNQRAVFRHALEEELERSWEIEMNGVGVPEAYAPAAG